MKEKDIYEKLQDERALERHELSVKREEKGIKDFLMALEDLKRKYLLGTTPEAKPKTEEGVEAKELSELKEELEKEIAKLATPEEVEEIKRSSWQRLRDFMKERRRKMKILEEASEGLDRFRKAVFEKPVTEFTSFTYDKINEYRDFIEGINESLEKELPNQNPESFYAHYLLKLREYAQQLPSGIIETNYPKEQKEKAKNMLFKNRLIALVGETGTGKTRIARKIAQELTGDYEFVAGHRFMTKEDLFSYLGIGVEKIPPERIPELIKEAKKRYYALNPETEDLPAKEREAIEEQIEEVLKGQMARPEMATKVFAAGILKAAKEGKIVIVDEFNYIPANLLAGVNALVEAKPGEKVNVLGEEIEVAPGFGIIFTGNITKAEFAGRYLKREEIDPALINRLNAGLIEYASLPQETSLSFAESIIERGEDREIAKRELFEIGLSLLADRKGNISGPRDLLERIWSLSREFSLLQKLYAGEKISEEVKLPNGQSYILEKYHASNRTFRSIIEGWKKDGYSYSIDWYVYDNLIRPASVIAPQEAGQIWILLKERGGFFQDKSWDVIGVDTSTWKISNLEAIEKDRKTFLQSQKRKEAVYYFSPKEVTEAMAGIRAPILETEEIKKEAVDRERMETYQNLQERTEKIREFIAHWEEVAELYCQDEREILGEK